MTETFLLVMLASFALLALVIVAGLNSGKITDKKGFLLWALLVEYLFIVVCATLICRQPMPSRMVKPVPFWTYARLTLENPSYLEAVKDIVINLLLFLPVGALLAGISPSLKWYWVLLIGVLCSLSIEILQYIFLRGVAQTDDLLHNTVSCLLGWGVVKMVVRKG